MVRTKPLQIMNRIDRQLFFLKTGTQLLHDSRQSEITMVPLDLKFRIRNHISTQSFIDKHHQSNDQQFLALINDSGFLVDRLSILS